MLEWRAPGDEPAKRARHKFYADWHDRDWGEITEQDYENLAQRAARDAFVGLAGCPIEPSAGEQHFAHARVIDRYLTGRDGDG